MLCQKKADFDTIGQNALHVSSNDVFLSSHCAQYYAIFL